MPSNRFRSIHILLALAFLFAAGNAYADIGFDSDDPPDMEDTYTLDEINAIERSLWAANLTLEDLNFRKDYTEAYECFPIVKDMLADPMRIANDIDSMIWWIDHWEETASSPYAEVAEGMRHYPDININHVWEALENYQSAIEMNRETSQTEDSLMWIFDHDMAIDVELPWDEGEAQILREFMPDQLAWHDVFESPYTEEQVEEWESMLENEPDDYIYQLMSEFEVMYLYNIYGYACPDPRGWLDELPRDTFPNFYPEIIETDYGRIGLGTTSDDVWEGDFTILIDPAGNDRYVNCRIGAAYGTEGNHFGYFVDLGGDDVYDCADTNITLGAAVMGVAAFYDLGQGNDRYYAGSCTLGAAMCGIATFYDDGGSDIYEGKVFTQGAAGFGIGVMVDESVHEAPVVPTDEETPDPIDIGAFDNDRYYAWTNAQAFARTKGVAICSNERGNEIYEAGGVYLHAPLFADRYQSFSQGFAIGERGIDYAGGIALIVDYSGNDRYLGDVYNQGVGYWYSAGLVYDGGGNDTYEMTQYGQGSGIHLAIGGLIDVSGNDSYTMHNGLGTGGSHDYAASVLHDRDGNDQYFGNTSCNGGSLTNSAVLFIDRAGNDTYAGRRNSGINFARPARGFTSIGVFVDLEGEDDYLGIMDNGMLWSHTDVGVGWDIIPPPVPEGEEVEPELERGQLGDDVPRPDVISHEGELTQEVFDELWEISIRWEVGDNRIIVPEARQRLIDFGPEILPYLSTEFDNMNSGLAIRAFDFILAALMEVDRDGVIDVLRENLASDEDMRRRIALAEINTLQATELEAEVAAILDDPDPGMQRRAISVIGGLGSHVADERLIANLAEVDDEALVKASMEALFQLEVYTWDNLIPLLDHPYISVRETYIRLIADHFPEYSSRLLYCLFELNWNPDRRPMINRRAVRSILEILAITDSVGHIQSSQPDLIETLGDALDHPDWGVRADIIKIAIHWQELASVEVTEDTPEEEIPDYDPELLTEWIAPLVEQIKELLETETDPYVLFIGDQLTVDYP